MKTGRVLSAMLMVMFFFNVANIAAFTDQSHATILCNGNSSQCDIEDESKESGNDFLPLVSFPQSHIPKPMFNVLAENSRRPINGNQSPLDFPPETI